MATCLAYASPKIQDPFFLDETERERGNKISKINNLTNKLFSS